MATRGFGAARLFVSLLLVAAMVMGIAATALADDNGNGRGKDKAFKAGFQLGQRFGDMNQASWADRFVTEAQLGGILRGYQEGGRLIFKPNQPVNRQEAVAMVVRGLGLEEEAQKVADSVYGVTLPFQDAGQIQSWAVGYVALALQKGYITSSEGMFQPNKAASRVWVVPVLVRAMGLGDEARQRMDETLAFKDAASIPADAVGYVAVAIDVGLIQGYEDRTFRPFQPVTRAQMAKVLQIMRDDLQQDGQQPVPGGVVKGVVAAVGESSLTVKAVNRTQKEYTVAAGAPVYLDDRPAALADLKPGVLVRLYLGEDGAAVLVDAHTARALEQRKPGLGKIKPHPRERELRGEVTAVDLEALTLTVGEETFKVAEWARVNVKGEGYGTLADIQVGDIVKVHVRGDLAVKIEVKGPEGDDEDIEDAEPIEIDGVITAVADGTVTVETEDGATVEVTVDAGTRIELDGRVITLDVLQVGDRVEVKLVGDTALRIKIEDREDGRGKRKGKDD